MSDCDDMASTDTPNQSSDRSKNDRFQVVRRVLGLVQNDGTVSYVSVNV